MRILRIAGLATCALLAAAPAARAAPEGTPDRLLIPDLLLINAAVKTPDGWAEAIAVRDGIITAVGDSATIAALKGAATRTLDLHGATVLPGLHDMHVHSLFAGLEQFACGFAYGAKPDMIAARVKACAAAAAPGAWIVGGNWVGAVFAKGQQTRAFLDAVAPDHPVLLNDEAHHSLWVNSRALALAGITRDTRDPPGGIIERDAGGVPTGLLREASATALIETIVPEPDLATKRRALTLSSNQMLSFGITSYTDATVRTNNMATLSGMAADGALKQRVRGCIVWTPGDAVGEALIAARAHYTKGRFKADCVKIFMDGVPTESHTAAMLHPYRDARAGDAAGAKGLLLVPQATLDAAVTRFDRQGLHIKFHAVGDAAVNAAIDAVAAARAANGPAGSAHDIGHGTFVDPLLCYV